MLRRIHGYLTAGAPAAPDASRELEARGYTVLRQVLHGAELEALRKDVARVFAELPPDRRSRARSEADDAMFRYEMLNRSAESQRALGHPAILAVIEPLLGDDCHVIANTSWRNPAGQPGSHGGQAWHIDAGPHVPRPEGVPWPDEIPYPVFAIAAHLFLGDCGPDDGPTAVIPRSHRSGRFPPFDRLMDATLSLAGEQPVALLARAGDVALFASDIWHRRLPTGAGDGGRFFLQVHYGRRDLAQRLRTTDAVNQLSDEARQRATTDRERALVGLHRPLFYDG